MGDADETYPLQELAPFVDKLEEGDDLVIGSRFEGTIHGDAMPFLNRFVGNPILTGMLNLLFGVKVSDAHCGMRARAQRRAAEARPPLDRNGVRVGDGLQGVPPRADGQRDPDRLLPARRRVEAQPLRRRVAARALHAPVQPELAVPRTRARRCCCSGIVGMLALATGPVDVFGRTWQIHTMLGFVALTLIGAQVIQLGVFARTYARVRIGEHDPLLDRLGRRLKLEHGLLVGGGLALLALDRPRRGRRRVGARRLRDARARLRDCAPRDGARARHPDRVRVVLPRAALDAAAPRRATADEPDRDAPRSTGTSRSTSTRTAATRSSSRSSGAESACSTSAARAATSRARSSRAGCTVVGLELDPEAAAEARATSARRCSSATSRRWSCRSSRARSTSSSAATSSSTSATRRRSSRACAAPPRRRTARADDAERRQLGDAPRAPRRALAIHGARHPRPHAHAPLHARDARRDARARGLPRRRARLHRAAAVARTATTERIAHAVGSLRPPLFAYQFVVAAEPA